MHISPARASVLGRAATRAGESDGPKSNCQCLCSQVRRPWPGQGGQEGSTLVGRDQAHCHASSPCLSWPVTAGSPTRGADWTLGEGLLPKGRCGLQLLGPALGRGGPCAGPQTADGLEATVAARHFERSPRRPSTNWRTIPGAPFSRLRLLPLPAETSLWAMATLPRMGTFPRGLGRPPLDGNGQRPLDSLDCNTESQAVCIRSRAELHRPTWVCGVLS